MSLRLSLALLIAALVLAIVLDGFDVGRQVQSELAYAGLAPQIDNEGDPKRPGALARIDADDRYIRAGKTIMVGDSNVAFGPWQAACLVNRGIGGERSDQLLANIRKWHSLDRAAAVVVAIGTNDVWQWRAAGLESRARAIVAEIEAPTLLVGIASRLRGADAANDALRRACTGQCRFIEPIAELGRDGIHLSPRGYEKLTSQLGLACVTRALPSTHH